MWPRCCTIFGAQKNSTILFFLLTFYLNCELHVRLPRPSNARPMPSGLKQKNRLCSAICWMTEVDFFFLFTVGLILTSMSIFRFAINISYCRYKLHDLSLLHFFCQPLVNSNTTHELHLRYVHPACRGHWWGKALSWKSQSFHRTSNKAAIVLLRKETICHLELLNILNSRPIVVMLSRFSFSLFVILA